MSLSEKSTQASRTDIDTTDDEKNISVPKTEHDVDEDNKYLSGVPLALVILGLCLAVLLVGLDNSILSTAVPTITTKFNSLEDVGWYGSAFLICVCAFQPTSGKLYDHFSLKWTFLFFLAIFEVGSLLCATAVSSAMLIIGRAVAGMGAAGLFSGALVIVAHSIAPRQRPIYTGIVASMFSISNIVGPLLGGAFTENVSWRWCFYINLPLGSVAAVVLIIFFRPKDSSTNSLSFQEKLKHLDLPGLALFMPAVVMLLLALQWGGHTHPWKSATIIGLFVGFGITMITFAVWQWHQKDEASIPFRIIGQKNVYLAVTIMFFGLGSVQLIAYYLPMWFQVIKDATPVESGIRLLPSVLGTVVMSLLSGALVTKFGYFNPWLFLGSGLLAIGGGILSTFDIHTTSSMINGIQVLVGMGSAIVIQMPLIALMVLLPQSDISLATSTSVFFQFFGGALFLAVGENIFVSRLKSSLHEHVPSLNAAKVVAAGATGLKTLVKHEGGGEEILQGAMAAYNVAIMSTFYLCAAGAGIAFLCGFGVEWGGKAKKQEQQSE